MNHASLDALHTNVVKRVAAEHSGVASRQSHFCKLTVVKKLGQLVGVDPIGSLYYDIVKSDPGDGVYTSEYAQAALDELEDEDVDVNGSDWEAPPVEVTEGGE